MKNKSHEELVDFVLSKGHQEQALWVKVPAYFVNDAMYNALKTFEKEFPGEEVQGTYSSLARHPEE